MSNSTILPWSSSITCVRGRQIALEIPFCGRCPHGGNGKTDPVVIYDRSQTVGNREYRA